MTKVYRSLYVKLGVLFFGISFIFGTGKLWAVMEEEFQLLQKRVMELEKVSFPPEKTEAIKKVTEYVCSNGHTYSKITENKLCPEDGLALTERSSLIKVKFNRREEIGEKISGMLEEELKKRVHVALSGTGIVQHIADSLNPDVKKETFAQGSVNVYLVSRPLRDTIFFIDLESQGGQGPDAAIANNSVLNNATTSLPTLAPSDQVRLREAWIQKNFQRDQIQLVVGKVDVTNYFDRNRVANDETAQFITGTLVNNPLIGNPSNGPGAVLYYDPHRGVAVGFGIQSPDSSGRNVTEEPFCIGEIDFRSRFLAGSLGNARFWAARNGRVSGDFRDNYSVGVSLDQEIGSHAVLFGRLGRSVRKEPIRDPHAWSVGVMFHNFLSQRSRDRVGIGYSHTLTAVGSGVSGEVENSGEVYYSVFLSDHLTLSPIGQFLFHSAGNALGSAQSNIFILGLRTQVYF